MSDQLVAGMANQADAQDQGADAAKDTITDPLSEAAAHPSERAIMLDRQPIGEKLVGLGLITRDQLNVALYEKRQSPKMLGTILIELGFVTDQALALVLAEKTGLQRLDLKHTLIDPSLSRLLPKAAAQRCRAVPVADELGEVHFAMADPYDVLALDEIRRHLPPNRQPRALVATLTEINDAIERLYGYEGNIQSILNELETGQFDLASLVATEGQYRHPVVRLVDWFLLDAVKIGASDIHYEPEASFIRVRYRIDGLLHLMHTLHRDHWQALSHRLKIMAGMNIADSRNIQDGRFTISLTGTEIDFRVSLLPTSHGENIVLRVLDHRRALLPLEVLGFAHDTLQMMRKIIRRPEGITIITGPTGCGKTTTLYSLLQEISGPSVNIMTLEDPIEYRLPLIRQTQVREGQLGFADGVRAILRQDPDIVFIGEIRDQDTAQMALRAAMTGHQVYSTLHTNDSFGVLPRLVDLGLNPQVLVGNVTAAIAQRLVQRLCVHCKRPRAATGHECTIMGLSGNPPPQIFEAPGCDKCRGTGFKGRVAVIEILRHTPEMDELLLASASRMQRLKLAREQGFNGMAEDGFLKVLKGEISLAALSRAVDLTDRY